MSKKYTLQAFEQLAQNTIKHFKQELVSGEPTAIPISELIELHLGLSVQRANLSPNDSIHGVTVFEDCNLPIYNPRTKQFEEIFAEAGTIFIDSKLFSENRSNRLRFTLAHELAHWLIHQENFVSGEKVAYKTSNNSKTTIEREADRLAAALLMPYGRVKVAYSRLKGKLVHEAVIHQLSTIFCVSTQAMAIRLEQLDFVDVKHEHTESVKKVLCPHCGHHLMDIVSSSQPFQSNVPRNFIRNCGGFAPVVSRVCTTGTSVGRLCRW